VLYWKEVKRMNLHEEQKTVQKAMNNALSGLQEDPWLTQRILANAKGEEPVTKKLTVSTVLVMVLIVVSMSAALAAGLGLFDELAQKQNADARLEALSSEAIPVSTSLTTEDGITIEMGQAYYEGNRVFLSYRLSGNLTSVELHEGAPEKAYAWSDVIEHFVVEENWENGNPELQKLNLWLDGKGQRWGISSHAALHDGLFLQDGTYLDIIGGSEEILEDGSIIGWKECEIPQDKLADELTFKAVLFCNKQVQFQDGSTFKRHIEKGKDTEVFFTLARNDRITCLKGMASSAPYQACAEFVAGKVDLKGTIRLTAPQMAKSWMTWDENAADDVILHWNLYQNGSLVSQSGTQSIRVEDDQTLIYEQLTPHMEKLEGLTLAPVYSASGEHGDEALALEPIIKE